MVNIDPAELRDLENHSSLMKIFNEATTGLVIGTLCGTMLDIFIDVRRIQRNVPTGGQMLGKYGLMGKYGLTCGAYGVVYGGVSAGVKELVQNFRGKRDVVNGAVGAFVASATIMGYKGRSISTALFSGSVLAFTSAVLDFDGQTMKHDDGKEYAAYTTKKRPSTDA